MITFMIWSIGYNGWFTGKKKYTMYQEEAKILNYNDAKKISDKVNNTGEDMILIPTFCVRGKRPTIRRKISKK